VDDTPDYSSPSWPIQATLSRARRVGHACPGLSELASRGCCKSSHSVSTTASRQFISALAARLSVDTEKQQQAVAGASRVRDSSQNPIRAPVPIPSPPPSTGFPA
jgi:hypothetical protein